MDKRYRNVYFSLNICFLQSEEFNEDSDPMIGNWTYLKEQQQEPETLSDTRGDKWNIWLDKWQIFITLLIKQLFNY